MNTTEKRKEQSLRDEIQSELEATRAKYRLLIGSLSDADWGRRSGNPAWKVGELLFHIALRLQLLSGDVRLVRSIGWAPKIPLFLFNWITIPVIRFGARNHTLQSVAQKYDDAHAVALRLLDTIDDEEWDKGVRFPDWDPLLSGHVTIERLFRHPANHFEAHANEIRAGLKDLISQE